MAASGTTEHTEQPSGGHKEFPPFQKDTFASQILWLVVTFVALYMLMARVALPRIGGIIDQRKGRIDGDLAEAERLKQEADAALMAYEKALADARARAHTLTSERRESEAAAAVAKRKALDVELNGRIAEAEKAIAERKSAAMANIRGIATETASALVQRLIGMTPAPQEVDAAVTGVLKLSETMFEAETWVALAFVAFVGVLLYFGAQKIVLGAIDERRDRIKAELDEARRLREEAQALLSEYQRRRQAADDEVAGILAGARSEAERLAAEARTKAEDFLTRRTRMAETKIAQAEMQALADVRSTAADAAVAAAAKILRETVKGQVADDLIDKGVRDLEAKLN